MYSAEDVDWVEMLFENYVSQDDLDWLDGTATDSNCEAESDPGPGNLACMASQQRTLALQ